MRMLAGKLRVQETSHSWRGAAGRAQHACRQQLNLLSGVTQCRQSCCSWRVSDHVRPSQTGLECCGSYKQRALGMIEAFVMAMLQSHERHCRCILDSGDTPATAQTPNSTCQILGGRE